MPYGYNSGNLQFNHETGFHGVVKIGKSARTGTSTTEDDFVTLLATSGSASIAHDPIMSSGIWGAGWYNAAEQVAYSNNVLKITGSVGYELVAGDIFDVLLKFGFTERASTYGRSMMILPDGKNGFYGPAWCSSVSMTASTDSNVTGDIQYSGAILSRVSSSIGENFIIGKNPEEDELKYGVGFHPGLTNLSGRTGENKPGASGDQFLSLYPFWASSVHLGKKMVIPNDWISTTNPLVISSNENALFNVQDWNVSYNSSVEFMTLCSGYNTTDTDCNGPITPDYIMIGSMNASGSFTFVGLSNLLSPESIYSQKSYDIVVRPNNGLDDSSKWGKISLPSVVYNNVNIQTTSGNQLVTAGVDFAAIGDGSKPPMSFSKYDDNENN